MNKKKIADELAKSLGFVSADYIGMDGKLSIYAGNNAIEGDKTPKLTGLPLWISVDDEGDTDFDFGFKYMYLINDDNGEE